jgi:hypothetical protein
MSSSIRNIRDKRGLSTHRERREDTRKGENLPKTYDAKFTAHSSSVELPALSGEASRTDHKIDHAHEILREQAQRIQTMTANAILTDRREFFYYKRKKTGRRCSCFLTETSPDNQCHVCLGVGVVGGYDKHGTITEILDFTSPGLVLVNVEPTLSEDTRPVYLKLSKGATFGYAECEVPVRANVGEIDTYMLFQPIFNRGAKLFAVDPVGNKTEIKGCDDWKPFLEFDKIKIRVEFSGGDERPLISHVMLRYKILPDLKIYGDVERAQENLAGHQFGFYDMYAEIQIAFDGKTIRNFQNEDVLYRLEDQRRLKITAVTDNFFASTLTSSDIRARNLISEIDKGSFNLLF